MKEYKVLSPTDAWSVGKFNPATLEANINSYARQGWEVKAAFSGEFFTGAKAATVIILEREIG